MFALGSTQIPGQITFISPVNNTVQVRRPLITTSKVQVGLTCQSNLHSFYVKIMRVVTIAKSVTQVNCFKFDDNIPVMRKKTNSFT